jgi:hypothetical protein
MALFTPTGGIVYHLRARRHRERSWLPFRRAVRGWLEQALPPTEELVLVGPSAGHCLPLDHLNRFARVTVLEPDPVARWLLGRSLRVPSVTERRDLLVGPLLSDSAGLDHLLRQKPQASVLFCNLLGQIQLGLSDEQQLAWRSAFRARLLPALEGRRWASFHDLWSLDRSAREPLFATEARFDRAPSDDELGRALFGDGGPAVAVLDHGTARLFPEALPRRYFTWQLTPDALHVVEGVSG